TCHDVHRPQRDVTAFVEKCLTCHETSQHPMATEIGERLTTACIDCHMPNRGSKAIEINAPTKQFALYFRSHAIGIYPEVARAVLQRLGPSAEARRAKAPTLREKEYLHAVEVLYGDGAKAARDTAYSKAMERLVAAFPTDREAQVLYGVSLLGLSQGVRDVPTYLRAAAIAQRVFRDNPNHPGAAHLLIHCYDDATHAALGLSAARAYSRIAPDAPHAQHMPTHIFLA